MNKFLNTDRYDFTFMRGAKAKVMRCQPDQETAKGAFMAVYGYWPDDAVWVCRHFPKGV